MIKKLLFPLLTVLIIIISTFLILEIFFKAQNYFIIKKGGNLKNYMITPRIYNQDYGWELKKNFEYTYLTADSDIIKKKTNNLGLASEFNLDILNDKFKILVIGDSFTESLGVNTPNSWPNQLQKKLKENLYNNVEIYNGAIAGYNLDQYYFRIKDLFQKIKPDMIIIGFATATDFYDVGKFNKYFVYGDNIGRNYFEVINGELNINTNLNSIENFATKYQLIENFKKNNPQDKEIELLQSIKELLHTSSVYERIKKSTLIVKIAMSLRNNERSLWPSTEIGIAKENTPLEKNKINLIKKIFEKISYEFGAKTDLFLIHIPYKVEVDKKFWSKTFGKHPEKFDQSGPEKKLISLITNKQIKFIPSVAKFRDKFNNEKKELYLKNDGHLNKFGNELVSEIVLENIEKYLQIKVVN
jgi:lysophospholipase L1-like esterase